MKRFLSLLAAAATVMAVAAFAFALAPATTAQSDSFTLMEFNIMHGVPRPYTGSTNPIRDINGGGLPWVLTAANGELKGSGHLEIQVKGLVLDPNDPAVISRGLAGDNPIGSFVAIVSCQSIDGSGAAVVVNVASPAFPATTGLVTSGGGDASFEGTLSLPSPCLAPIVFIGPNSSTWFAVTGH